MKKGRSLKKKTKKLPRIRKLSYKNKKHKYKLNYSSKKRRLSINEVIKHKNKNIKKATLSKNIKKAALSKKRRLNVLRIYRRNNNKKDCINGNRNSMPILHRKVCEGLERDRLLKSKSINKSDDSSESDGAHSSLKNELNKINQAIKELNKINQTK